MRNVKLGVMVPTVNSTMEPELYRMVPKNVSIHFARLAPEVDYNVTLSLERLLGYAQEATKAAKSLAIVKPNVIAFGCTSGSLLQGIGYDQEIIKRIESTTGIPGTTTSTCVIAALKHLKMKKVCVATPYPDWINEKTKEFLESNGIGVLRITGLEDKCIISDEPPENVYRLAKDISLPAADGVFISCTALRTIEILESLEKEIKKPVVSSNQATLWMMLKMAGVSEEINNFGTLLRSF